VQIGGKLNKGASPTQQRLQPLP